MHSHTRRQAEEEKRREYEMLVKHEFSAKTDARKEKEQEFHRMCTICGTQEEDQTAALCAAFFFARRSSPAIKVFKYKL